MQTTIRSLLRFLLLICLVFPFHIFPASAGMDQWTSIGPEGGVVHALAIAPSNPNILYAGTSGGGVYKTVNGGANWQPANAGVFDRFTNEVVIDPLYPNVVYLSTEGGIFRTTDYGEHWSSFVTGLTNTNVWSVSLSPVNPKLVYATTIGMGVVQQQITRPEIFSGTFEAPKKLTLGGRTLGDVARVVINDIDRTDHLVSVSETTVQIKGKAKKLGLRAGNNTIELVDSGGKVSNEFVLAQ